MKEEVNNRSTPMHEPIAIVGMSCRFPEAHNLDEFWQLLHDGQDTVTEIPKERWDNDAYYDPDPAASRKSHQRHASMLKNIDDFDTFFFNISPAEAAEMNPSQKLMLELVWEAIENSTLSYKKVQGTKTGVYVGNIWADFEHLRKHKYAPVTSHSAVGQSSNIIANRVSFAFGLSGPSLVVDTGCSSSLVALHIACQALWDGSTEMAIAAGVNHILDPDQNVLLSKFGGLSKKGKCSTFDIEADGFVRGEGAGVLLLKRLSDAERDGDKIYALVAGSAMNNNGYNVNLPATSVNGQKQVLADAYRSAGIEPHNVHYVEAHGTGTRLGDPTESRALGEFFSAGRLRKLRVGSVKTNIGHLEAAAGIAGLIKVVLAMRHRMLPPSLNFKTPNPDIPFEELKLQVNNTLSAWPATPDEPLLAGINSFGWGGTNAHTVIQEYRPRVASPAEADVAAPVRLCLPLSAKSPAALKAYARAYAEKITMLDEQGFLDLCVATALLKPEFDYRITFAGTTRDEVLKNIEDFLHDENELTPTRALTPNDKVVFIFPGQGSQWLGMGRELYATEPVFRDTIDALDKAFRPFTDWSLLEQLHATPENSRLQEINVIQPALSAVQMALASVWMAWGIKPHAVAGHSMGEVAAAYCAGILTLNDAARIICTRSTLMKRVSGTGGAMAVTELTVQDAEHVVKRYPQLSVAVSNSPKSTVLAGDKQAIDAVIAELENQQLFARLVKVDVASHSQQMDPLKAELREALVNVQPQPAAIPLISTVRKEYMDGAAMNADYWVDNLRGTVQFSAVMDRLMEDRHTVFIEVSPHPVLINAMNECAEAYKHRAITVPSTFRDKPELESLFRNIGDLYAKGFSMPWSAYYKTTNAPFVSLPSYPFQREHYALEDKTSERSGAEKAGSRFPLLGTSVSLAGLEHIHYWESQISLAKFPYLKDHQVNEIPVFPGAGYIEIILEAASQLYTAGVPIIKSLAFIRSVELAESEATTVQLRITEHDKRQASFGFYSRTAGEKGEWVKLAEGELLIASSTMTHAVASLNGFTPDGHVTTGSDYYPALRTLGLQYGKYFQGLNEIRRGNHNRVYFTLNPDDLIRNSANKYLLHPALLDACLQPLFFDVLQLNPSTSERTTFLTAVDDIQLLGTLDYASAIHGEAKLYAVEEDRSRGTLSLQADIIIRNGDHTPVVKILGLKGKVFDTHLLEQEKENLKNWLYEVHWQKDTRPAAVSATATETWLLFGDVYGLSGVLTERMDRVNINFIHVTPGVSFEKRKLNSYDANSTEYTINYANSQDYRNLLNELFKPSAPKISGIIHMGGIYYPSSELELKASELEREQAYGSVSILYLLQHLEYFKLSEYPKLTVVTNGMQSVRTDHHAAQIVHAPLSGLMRVLTNELPQYQPRRYDLSFNPMMEELDQLLEALRLPDVPHQEVALRGNEQYTPRLVTASMTLDESLPTHFTDQGTYLVTGFRGLGFKFMEWMIRQGARHFALVSRTGQVPADVTTQMHKFQALGCTFNVYPADAANYEAMQSVFATIADEMPPLRGVVHAAGVIEAKPFTAVSEVEFLRTLSPKMKGGWNLHLLTRNMELDCFVLFSSASTLFGLSGQAGYVSANSFLDVLAHYRRKMNLPAQSINWGVMNDVGMVANEAELERYARAEGFVPVPMTEAMDVYHTISGSNLAQTGIVKIQPPQMAQYYSALARTEYFKTLLVTETTERTAQKAVNFLIGYRALDSEQQQVEVLEQLIIQHVAKIIKLSTARVTVSMTFKGVGIDSLMAIQLRNLLEKDLHVKLAVSMFWAHPSIREYALFLMGVLGHSEAEQAQKEEHVKALTIPSDKGGWFVKPRPNPQARYRVFCFHDAGGSASLYHGWEEALDGLELVMVELPGRGRRLTEQPYSTMQALLHDLIPAMEDQLDKPFFFLGHSMGGVVAFELTRALRAHGKNMPQKLFISSTPGLTTYDKRQVDHTLPEAELVEMFPHLDVARIGDTELQQLFIGILRADLHLLNNYRYAEQAPLNIPIITLHGNDDPRVTRLQMEQWVLETTGAFRFISRPGGHRYIESDGSFVTALIREEAVAEPTPTTTVSPVTVGR